MVTTLSPLTSLMLVMLVGTLITNSLLSVSLVSVVEVFIKSDVCDGIGGYSLLTWFLDGRFMSWRWCHI